MKYQFNQTINSELKTFKSYLQELGNSENTIHQKSNYAGFFIKWLESERMQVDEARYNDMLNFIDYCNLESFSKKHINTVLLSVRNYYQFLKKTNQEIINPATNLYIKGTIKKIPSNIINYQELETLYQSFETNDNRSKRNKAILGLIIYQALTTEELHQLEPEHLKLKQGKIKVPGSRKRKSRILNLKPFQILELQEYITEIRPQINQQNSNQLFVSMEGNINLKNSLYHLFRAIKKTNPNIGSGKQIRASVITNWLKSYNLREVQYFAGHKYVSSTERYKANDLEGLKHQVEKFHPLN
jgi:integrase/recombinase XerD